jgi:hypothetical protein
LALPQALIPGVIQGFVESKPIRNLLIKRKAAKTAKSRASLTRELENEINKQGLVGVLAAGATTKQEQ